ncbi:MAG: hypothetical protein ACLFR1_05270 [Spirochaetia bacterium]
MKKLFILLPLIVVVMLTACAGGAEVAEEEVPERPRPEIIDHKNAQWDRPIPDWVVMEPIELQAMEDYEDVYVFKFESPMAESLEGARIWTNSFSAQSEIARRIRTRVEDRFAGAAAGDVDNLETYMEQVVRVLAQAEFSGYEKVGEFWVLRRYFEDDGSVDREAYTYMVMYTMPREYLDELIQNAMEEADEEVEPESAEETVARERVQEAMSEGF